MSHSRFLCLISAVVAGCGDDSSCGVGNAATEGLLASSADVTLQFSKLTAGANNDCPDTGSGVTSLTIISDQTNPNALFAACVPRPDQLATPRALGFGAMDSFQLVNVGGTVNGCSYALDRTMSPTGMATGEGVCDDGINAAGFSLTIDGAVPLIRTCGTTKTPLTVTLKGAVAVTPM